MDPCWARRIRERIEGMTGGDDRREENLHLTETRHVFIFSYRHQSAIIRLYLKIRTEGFILFAIK